MIFPNLYGLLIALGIWLGIILSKKAQKKLSKFCSHYKQFDIENIVVWIFVPALLGARAYHVIDLWNYYQLNPVEIVKIWQGGLGIYGAIIGGILGIALWREIQKPNISMLPIFDILVFGIPVAQAIGRLGNYFNQELFGLPTRLPWGIFIETVNRPTQFINHTHFHPIFLYEALLSLLLASFIFKKISKNRKTGFYFALYLIGYGLTRFSLEFLRINSWQLGFLTTAQWISLLIILLGFFVLKNKPPKHI
jgi:phosphatidylglycerol---prolipoprotein diacylglyceryl transferase